MVIVNTTKNKKVFLRDSGGVQKLAYQSDELERKVQRGLFFFFHTFISLRIYFALPFQYTPIPRFGIWDLPSYVEL